MNPSLTELAGWISVNIFVPVVLPFLILLLPKIVRKTRPYARGLILKAVEDGQLFWVTTALCAVGNYELYLYLAVQTGEYVHPWAIFVMVGLGAIALTSIVFVVLQALDIPGPAPANRQAAKPESDKVLVMISIIFVAVASVAASASHKVASTAAVEARLARDAQWRNMLEETKSEKTCRDHVDTRSTAAVCPPP